MYWFNRKRFFYLISFCFKWMYTSQTTDRHMSKWSEPVPPLHNTNQTFSRTHTHTHPPSLPHTRTHTHTYTYIQATISVCNSSLSEAAILGFEYGYRWIAVFLTYRNQHLHVTAQKYYTMGFWISEDKAYCSL